MRWKFLAEIGAVLLALTASLLAQSAGAPPQPKTAIGGMFVNVPGMPVEITSLTEAGVDLFDQVEIKNTSDKAISGVQFAWVVRAPEGCSTGSYARQAGVSRVVGVDLAPGESTVVRSLGLDARPIFRDASSQGVAFVHFQLGVEKVAFADGTSATTPIPPGDYFSPQLAQEEGSAHCAGGKLRLSSARGLQKRSTASSE